MDSAEETEWDERKQKHRAVTWSLDVSVAVLLRSGTIKKYFSDKVPFRKCIETHGNALTQSDWEDRQGFGFICPDGGGDDVFAHSRQYTGQGEADNVKAREVVKVKICGVQEGDRVKFDAEWDATKGNNKAFGGVLEQILVPLRP